MVHKSNSQTIKIRYNPNIDNVMKIMLNLMNSLNLLPPKKTPTHHYKKAPKQQQKPKKPRKQKQKNNPMKTPNKQANKNQKKIQFSVSRS